MSDKTFSIPYQSGELLFCIEKNGDAVLLDYCGAAKILYLPSSVAYLDEDGNEISYEVSPALPDLSFESCSNIEILVCGYETHFQFGDFVFLNCSRLKTIVLLSLHELAQTVAILNEFSFTENNYIPKKMRVVKLFLGHSWVYHHDHDLYLPDEPGYESTYALAYFFEQLFSFYDWLEENIPRLIMRDNTDPARFLAFINEFGLRDSNENKMHKDEIFDRETPTLTHLIPPDKAREWWKLNSMNNKQRRDENEAWENTVLKYFPSDIIAK